MAEQKQLNRKHKVENGKVIVTKTVEDLFNLQDLIVMKESVRRQKMQLIEQSKQLNQTYNALNEQEAEIEQWILQLSNTSNNIEIPEE